MELFTKEQQARLAIYAQFKDDAEIDKNFVHLREQTRAVLVSHIINRN